MKRTARAVALLVGVACLVSGAAPAATAWTVYRDTANGFSISTPKPWVLVPGSRAEAQRLAASYEKKGETRQATLVRAYLADNYQSGEDRVLDGIQFPTRTSPILTDFVFVKDHLPSGMKSDPDTLSLIAQTIFGGLAKQHGIKLNTKAPTDLRLPAGNAIEFSGSGPAEGFGGRRTGFDLYMLLGPARTEWQIEFRTDSTRLGADRPLFRRIAESLRFG
jgi:hypothetical protein